MKLLHFILFALLLSLSTVLTGCGDGNSGKPIDSAYTGSLPTSSDTCINCHSAATTPVLLSAKIVDQWRMSIHNTSKFAGCVDCHEPEVNHPATCSRCHGGAPSANNIIGSDVLRNPDRSSKCLKCHDTTRTYHYNPQEKTIAQFVTEPNSDNCRKCHNPHDVTSNMSLNRDWYNSTTSWYELPSTVVVKGYGHGRVDSPAWTTWDFKNKIETTSKGYECIRCHTATGFINYINGAFATPFPQNPLPTSGDITREVISCDACHSSYDFINSVRRSASFIAPYNNNNGRHTFPDVGYSNQCIACHSGRESMATIDAVTNFANTDFSVVSSHNMAAAGIMYGTTGFTGFTNSSSHANATYTYADSYTMGDGVGNISITHHKLGTPSITGDSHDRKKAFIKSGSYDANGPCVTCHLNASGRPDRKTSHTFLINGNAFDQVCTNCHEENGTTPLNSTNFKISFVDKKKQIFQNALTLAIRQLLPRYGIHYNRTKSPYFFEDPNSTTEVRDWHRSHTLSDSDARKLMGACYNIHLLTREPMAFVHNKTYTKRLIYDTIDFLDDGLINMSTGATAINSGETYFKKGDNANNTTTTSDSYKYLAGYNTLTGAWNTAYQRP